MKYAKTIILTRGTFVKSDLRLIRQAIDASGVKSKYWNDSTILDLSTGDDLVKFEPNQITVYTGRDTPLMHEIDKIFCVLLDRYTYAMARCSDCYACCSQPDTWLIEPETSNACNKSEAKWPSKGRILNSQSIPEDERLL